MQNPRSHMMCGLATNDEGKSKIVVAGGISTWVNSKIHQSPWIKFFFLRPDYVWGNLAHNKIVESFDLERERWYSEANFPFTPIGGSTNVQYGRDFLSVGGFTQNKASDTIYKVNFVARIYRLQSCFVCCSTIQTTAHGPLCPWGWGHLPFSLVSF